MQVAALPEGRAATQQMVPGKYMSVLHGDVHSKSQQSKQISAKTVYCSISADKTSAVVLYQAIRLL